MNEPGKRVSWVELYLDVVFVVAVGQIAPVIADRPAMRSVWIALGLFVTPWWTWIGFTVLYNRHGDDAPAQRLLFLAGTRAFLLAASRPRRPRAARPPRGDVPARPAASRALGHAFLGLLTAWAVMCAALTTRRGGDEHPARARYLGGRHAGAAD